MTADEQWESLIAAAALPPEPKKTKREKTVRAGYPNFYDPVLRRWYERKA